MPDSLSTKATKLKESINEDLLGSYSSLLDFSETYAIPGSKIKDEAVLLGSSIFELLGEGHVFDLDKAKAKDLIQRAEQLVDDIAVEAATAIPQDELLHEKVRSHFLQLKPKNDIVFEGHEIEKSFGKGFFCLQKVSLTLRLGEITGIVGENGNGKTTLLRIIAGDLLQSHGITRYPLLSPKFNDWPLIKRSIAYIPQNFPPLSSLNTVREHLHFTAAVKGIRGAKNEKIVDNIINRFNLKIYENRRWNELSGGYRLRFELARQLIWRPKLLVLDEPLANLDVKAQALVLTDIRNLVSSVNHCMALVISSQNLHEIEKISDNIIFMKNGKDSYNGPVADIGKELEYQCFELDTDYSTLELQKAISKLPIRDIRHNGQYTLIYADKEVHANELLHALIKAHVRVKFFRDISRSTRLLFEQ